MLQVIIGVSILLFIAFIGSRKTFIKLNFPLGARLIFLTGTEFIFVGVALGTQLIGLLDEYTIRSLTPLFSLGLGFIGLIFGIQLEYDKIVRFPASFLFITLIQSIVTMILVFFPFYFILDYLFPNARSFTAIVSLMLSATAACTAPTSLTMLSKELNLTGAKVMELLRLVASLDSIVCLTIFGFVFCLMQSFSGTSNTWFWSLLWFVFSLFIGITMGILLHMLTQVRCSNEELLIFVLGAIMFSGGVALYLKLSPLFVNMVTGITIANLKGSGNRIYNLLFQLEKPFYIVFLILAGATWHPGPTWSLTLIGMYLLLRFAGKMLGGYLGSLVRTPHGQAPGKLGLGLVSQGGLVIAMVMNWYQLDTSMVTDVVVTAVIAAVIISELASPTMAKFLLHKTGEFNN